MVRDFLRFEFMGREHLTHESLVSRVNGHPLIKMAYMFNQISLSIVDHESWLGKMTRELSFLNMT